MPNLLGYRGLKSGIVAAVLVVAVLSPLHAGTLTGTFTVTATVTGAACTTISASALSFGSIAPTATASSTSTVTINCATGTAYSVTAVGTFPGCSVGTSYNAMGTAASNPPVYQLFKDSGHTQVLSAGAVGNCGATATALTGTGTGASQTQTIFGVVNAGLTNPNGATAGSYSDTATLTLTF